MIKPVTSSSDAPRVQAGSPSALAMAQTTAAISGGWSTYPTRPSRLTTKSIRRRAEPAFGARVTGSLRSGADMNGTGANVTVTMFGRIPPHQLTATAGTYSDTRRRAKPALRPRAAARRRRRAECRGGSGRNRRDCRSARYPSPGCRSAACDVQPYQYRSYLPDLMPEPSQGNARLQLRRALPSPSRYPFLISVRCSGSGATFAFDHNATRSRSNVPPDRPRPGG